MVLLLAGNSVSGTQITAANSVNGIIIARQRSRLR